MGKGMQPVLVLEYPGHVVLLQLPIRIISLNIRLLVDKVINSKI
jgi:hypothetical protein